jgi:uncharacterized protein YcnI
MTRRIRMRMRAITAAATAAGMLVAFAAPAFAHVTANPNTAPTEGFFTTFFRVGHGCEGDGPDTKQVSIRIPDGVISAGPEDEPGWTAETKMRKLDEPIESEGEEITEVVSEVTWTSEGPPLDTNQFREFGLSLQLAAEDQDVLWFPTVQKCEQGSLRWVNIPPSVEEWGDTEDPAPYLELTPADEEAAAEPLTEDDVRAIAADEASADIPGEETDAIVWIALGLGVIALLLGIGAFARSGRRT